MRHRESKNLFFKFTKFYDNLCCAKWVRQLIEPFPVRVDCHALWPACHRRAQATTGKEPRLAMTHCLSLPSLRAPTPAGRGNLPEIALCFFSLFSRNWLIIFNLLIVVISSLGSYKAWRSACTGSGLNILFAPTVNTPPPTHNSP
jgi:hypothetical protein